MKKKVIIAIFAILIFVMLTFFLQNAYKKTNLGNNISNKTTDELVNTILNMKSYKAEIELNIKSNKNEHKYVLKQEKTGNKSYRQEVLEPSNIKGTIINYDGKKISVENTKLNLSKIYDDYPYITGNDLWLDSFILDYKDGKNASVQEINEEIILNTEVKNENKYKKYKTLTINKNTGKPIKLEIKDITQNIVVYILYNEIKIDSLQ